MMKLRALALLCLFWQLCATETAYREFKISLQPERLFEHLQKELPEKKKAKMLPAMLMLAGVQRIDLGVYLHSDGEYYPVAQIQAETEEKLTQILSNPLLAVALKKQSANQFVLTDVAVKAKGVTQYKDYLFTQKKHQLLVKPSFVTEEWKSPSTDFVGNEFLQLSFGIPEKLAEKIVTAITQATEDVESAKFMMAFFGGPIKAVADELQRYKAFEFSLGVDQDKKRFLRIKQMMSNAAEAKKQMARSEFSEKNIKTSTMFYGLSTLKKKGDLSWATKRQKNDISLNVSWMAKDDETVGQSLFGSLMGSMGGKRKKASEIETKYVTIETFQPGVSGADFERQLRAALPKAMFPGHYWGNSDKPKATIEFEPPVFANSFLTDLEYEILSAVDAAGKSILRREEKKKNRFFSRLNFGLNSHSSQLKVPVLKGCTKEQLVKARLNIHGTIPVLAERFEFSKKEGDGVVKASSGVEVRLEKIDLDQVRFSYAGKGKVELRAYDKTGGALSRSQWSNSGLTRTYVFRGIVDRVEAIVVAKSKNFTMEIDVDLNKGKSLELPKQASSEVRVRYDRFSRTTYQDFTQKELNSLKVEWFTPEHKYRQEALKISFPKKSLKVKAKAKASLFSDTEELPLKRAYSSFNDGSVTLSIDKDISPKVRKAFGEFELEVSSGLKGFTFNKQKDGEKLSQQWQGKSLAVTFNKNQLTSKLPKGLNELEISVYDAQGLPLKSGNSSHSSKKGSTRSYWGIPHKVVFQCSTKTLKRTVKFDITRGDYDKKAFAKYKQDLLREAKIVKAVKLMLKERRQISNYADDLAGLHYVYTRKGVPAKAISQEIAHANPQGAERFAYELKPYEGYYFVIAKGTLDRSGAQKPYKKQKSRRKAKWAKGELEYNKLYSVSLIAYPVDKSMPTYVTSWNNVYKKKLKGEELDFVRSSFYNTDWVEVK